MTPEAASYHGNRPDESASNRLYLMLMSARAVNVAVAQLFVGRGAHFQYF